MAQDPYLGRQILGQYHIEKKLGEGGMGMVYLADQPAMSRKAAIKILRPEIASEEQIMRFQREAQALANMDHPHIVKVYNFGTLEDDALYMAMEFVQGRELDGALQAEGQMHWERAVNVVIMAADALVEAHTNGIVHRDLKPENILLMEWRGNPDYVKVLDFGIAKVLDNSETLDTSATMAGVIHGTPMYMSPEQARGDTLDHRSDVYSLGIVLYAMITGELPIKSNTLVGYIIAHQQDPPAPVAGYVQDVPKDVEKLLMKMLEKRPEDRQQNMQQVLDELRATVAPKVPRSKGLKVGLAAAAVLLLVLAGVIGYMATRQPKVKNVGFAAGITQASDNKQPKWVGKPLSTKGDRTMVVGKGVAETKSDAKEQAGVAAQMKILEQVAKLVTSDKKDEGVFKAAFEASKGKEAKPSLLGEAAKSASLPLGEPDETYWAKKQPKGGGSAEYHYYVLHGISLKKQLAAKASALANKTSFGVRVIPFLPVFAAGYGVPGGVLVTKLKKKSKPLKRSGLKVGDVIIRVAGKSTPNIKTFAKVMKKAAKASKRSGPFEVEIARITDGEGAKKTLELSK